MPPKTTLSLKERIEQGIERIPESGCWLWRGASNPKGYGKIRIDGKNFNVHRVSFEVHVRPLLPGENVLHSCDTPPCCNPHHLFAGSIKDNAQDAKAKGRIKITHHVGEKHGMSKLTEVAVLDIRNSSENDSAMAKKYGVSVTLIGDVRNRRIWRHI